MLYRMFLVYRIAVRVFRKPISPIFTFIAFFILNLIVSIGMILDRLFFPSLNRIKLKKPIVVVGNPRSGTTFLQRFLVNNRLGTGTPLWKMLYPSLTIQFFLKPLLPLLEKISPARFHQDTIHKTNLTAIETDDPALLFRYFDGFFLYGFFLSWAEKDFRKLFDPARRSTSKRDFIWMEKIWKRNLVGEKKEQLIGKMFSLGIRVPDFLEFYPDAKIIYLARDPLETVPSALSLVTGVLDARFGFWKMPVEKRSHFINRLYEDLLELTVRFFDDYQNNRIPEKNLLLVPYNGLMKNFEQTVLEIAKFAELPLSDELRKIIHQTDEKQKNYVSKHKYQLEKFGLTKEKIQIDYAFLYEMNIL